MQELKTANRRQRSPYFTAQGNGMIKLLAEIVAAEVVKKIAMPQLQHEQTPDARGVITPSVKMIVQ